MSAVAPPVPRLSVKDLSVTYVGRGGERTEAVRDVSFDIADKPGAGEIVVFLGGRVAALNRMYMTAWVKGWKRPRLSVLRGGSETEVPQ